MTVSKIGLNIKHIKWCHNFMKEQTRSTRLVRKILKQSRDNNPFNTNRDIDNILKRYERNFWG